MKVEFLKKFSKDLDNIKIKSVKQSVIRRDFRPGRTTNSFFSIGEAS